MELSNCSVRPMQFADLEMVLAWRNAPEIRRYMFTQHEIALTEHTNWFKRVCENPAFHLLIFEKDGVPRGFVSFKRLDHGALYDWGFYMAPGSQKGMGRLLGMTSLNYAFKENNFHKVCGQAIAYNQASINFHLKLGFSQEGLFREQYYDGDKYHDVLHFGLLANEWNNRGI